MRYSTITEVFDLGPFISKVILELESTLTECEIDKEAFEVYVVRKDKVTGATLKVPKFFMSEELLSSEGTRKVVSAYVSDKEGRKSKSGAYITLELEVDPRISVGATITYNGSFNVRVDSEYTITQRKPIINGEIRLEDMIFHELNRQQTLLADKFITGESTSEGIPLTYAAYQPVPNGKKKPLLIWLHGAGEGGSDPVVAVIGNKVVNLISDKIQQFFGDCYVLAPQAPTMWMDDGTGGYNTDGSSMYVKALKNLIDKYIASQEEIDLSRIYLGGCSNGGFMTVKMIIEYPKMFAAAYPICEALTDKHITDEDIEKIKEIPIWFTHAANDPIVKMSEHSEATYKRLIKAGAANVHFTSYPSVTDQTGEYLNQDGTRYEYNGHFSWIPALNNECTLDYNNKPVVENGKEVTMFEWLSMQINNRI
jgi:predicted peptidase